MRALAPTFRSSCYASAPTFHELRKVMGTSKSMILVPLCHLKFPDGIRRLRCRNFKWAAPVAMIGLLALGGCASDTPIEQPSMYFNMAEPGAKLDAQAAATMISLYRKNNGVGAVVIDPELMRVAEGQSQAMASRNKLDHDVKAPLPKRLQAAGYPSTLAVENVSAGYHTLAEAFSGWRELAAASGKHASEWCHKNGHRGELCSKYQIQGVLDAHSCINRAARSSRHTASHRPHRVMRARTGIPVMTFV